MEQVRLQALDNFNINSDAIMGGGAIEENTCYIIFILLLIIGGWIIYKVYKWFMSREFYSNCTKKVVGPVEVETCH